MSDNKSTYQIQIEEIGNYLNRKLEDNERHDFESVLQHDAFLEEAVEGISMIKMSELERDVHSLGFGERGRKLNLKPLLWVVPIIVLAGLVYLLTQIDIKMPTIKLPSFKKEQKEVVAPDSLSAEPEELVIDTLTVQDSSAVKLDSVVQPTQPTSAIMTVNQADKQPVAPKIQVIAKKPAATVVAQRPVQEVTHAPAETTLTKNIEQPTEVQPIVKEEVAATENKTEAAPPLPANAKKSAPTPSVGEASYEAYLDSHVSYPEEVEKKNKETVRLKFTLTANGEMKNFELLRGPKETAFTNEAIKVIKNGPKWVPAVKDGKYVDDEVTVKINFKP